MENQLNTAIDQAVEYVDQWKRKELFSFAINPPKSDTIPVCIPIGKNTYVIGSFGLKKNDTVWTVTSADRRVNYNFMTRSSAVVYSICVQTGRKKLAQDILDRNNDLFRLQNRLVEFQYLQAKAQKKKDKDYWRLDYYTIMAESAEFAIIDAKNQLEKSLNLAKYFKIWE